VSTLMRIALMLLTVLLARVIFPRMCGHGV
jgi:hypothetical protein